MGAKAKSVVFAFASDFAHKICFKLLKQIFVIFRKTPLSSPCSVQPEFSSAVRLFRAHHFYARRIHLSCISKSFCKLGCAVIYFIKPQTHGKSQHCEIFVNKAAEPRRKRAMPAGYCEKLASCVAAKSVVLLARVIWLAKIVLS